ERVFVLDWRGGTDPASSVFLSQRDVRELQFAKASIATGWSILLSELGVGPDEISQVLLAGSFGAYLTPLSAVRIGLVPRIARRRGWDLNVVPVPALLHNHPERIADAVDALSLGHDVVAVAYGDCGTYGGLDELPRLEGEHCYDVFGRSEVRDALEEEPGT